MSQTVPDNVICAAFQRTNTAGSEPQTVANQKRSGEIEGEDFFPIQVHSRAYYFYYDKVLFLLSMLAKADVVPTFKILSKNNKIEFKL